MRSFTRINNITGWIVFVLAATVYLLTMEPTVSLWDSGEFTAAAAKLEVGHPPGAPFYLMLARIFSLFAPGKSSIAICINSLSAIASAFTVLFLFWTITHLAKKFFYSGEDKLPGHSTILIIGSGVIGALSFCFSDSFWTSATEAEVYAMSSLFTAIVFWSILKWEEDNGKYSNRWLVLIAYLMGISIGIHLLNLLAIPAIVMVYFYRRYTPNLTNSIGALVVSLVILFIVLYLVIPGTVKVASVFERVSVNHFGMPVNSGLAFFIVFSILFLILLAWFTFNRNLVLLNTVILCVTVILIGYSSYAMIVIRAQANPPLNTGNPSDAYSLLSYLNRDQYGESPLLYGPYYNAPSIVSKTNNLAYSFENGKYTKVHTKKSIRYDERFMTLFPRMYSSNPNHVNVYKDWGTIQGTPVKIQNKNGTSETLLKPDFLDNVEFFLKYQVGYMYLRYFMWNFAGKQNDLQGNGGIMKGNWISGFDFIDKWFIGPQNALPGYMKNNMGRNRYFLLPLLLGLGGLIFQFSRSKRFFAVIALLFILTGFAIVLYTNQTPLQPRERDYVYVGSFYAFSIWIGLGLLWVFNLLKRKLNTKKAILTGIVLSLSIPVIMFSQNIDDHNRNGRYIIRDIAYNYLISCEPNSILFTIGDNDTYPLWYLQEVEGIRTDVRVVNLTLLNTPWYIDQQKYASSLSKGLPLTLTHDKYSNGRRNIIYLGNENNSSIFIEEVIEGISNERFITETFEGSKVDYIPSRNLFIPFKDEAFGDTSRINVDYNSDSVIFKIPGTYIGKNELIVMDIIAHTNWKRPVYFDSPGYRGTLGLDNYLEVEGFTYKLVPQYAGKKDSWYGKVDSEKQYDILMHQTRWDELKNGKVLIDDHVRNMLAIMKVRQNYARLALALCEEGKTKKAVEVLDRVMLVMPPSKIPYDQYCLFIAEAYYKLGSVENGDRVVREYATQLNQELNFFNQLSPWMKSWVNTERSHSGYYLEKLNEMLKKYKRNKQIKPF